MPDWDAEVVVDEELVREVLVQQFPELDASGLRFLGQGWDNSVWIVGEAWAFRFPRRALAVPLVARELDVLPLVGPLLPVPVPEPRFVGEPSERFPWPFFGAPLLRGVELADARLADAARVDVGASLGRALRALHDAAVDVELPVDPNRRADMAHRVPKALEFLAELEATRMWQRPAAAGRLFEVAEELPPPSARVLLHGDLHARHALVEEGRLTGILDWGDCCFGDPSIDLQVGWSLLSGASRERFVAAYGPVADETVVRARVVGASLSAMLAVYAHSVGNEALLHESVASLARVFE